jgi:hypothetical protein
MRNLQLRMGPNESCWVDLSSSSAEHNPATSENFGIPQRIEAIVEGFMAPKGTEESQHTPHHPEHVGSRRDPEERPTSHPESIRDKMHDKTLADSFPTSDPPSSIPDPGEDDSCGNDQTRQRKAS